MKKYIAICVDYDGETIILEGTNYDMLMDDIDSFGYDVLDVEERDENN
jgi:hypothetical protein